MPSYNFKKKVKFYIVVGGLRYQVEINPDLSFSQTFEESSRKVKTLHAPRDMFEAASIIKASPLNFSFTMPIHTHLETKPILMMLLDYADNTEAALKTCDIYVDTGQEIFKLETCVFERGTFNISKDQVISISISGSGSKLYRYGSSGNSIPGTVQASTTSYAFPDYYEARFMDVLIGGVSQPSVVGVNVEITNEVSWLPNETLHKSLAITGPSDTVYPEAFVVSGRTISGNIQQYVTDANINNVQTWSIGGSLSIKIAKSIGDYQLQINIPQVVYTNRIETSDLFLQYYDFRMTSNPSDLSTVIQYSSNVVPPDITSTLWRMYITNKRSLTDTTVILEMEWKNSINGSNLLVPTDTVTTVNNVGGYEGSKAIDGSLGTWWSSTNSVLPAWIAVQKAVAYKVDEIVVYPYADVTSPSVFTMQYWNGSQYIDSWNINNTNSWNSAPFKIFNKNGEVWTCDNLATVGGNTSYTDPYATMGNMITPSSNVRVRGISVDSRVEAGATYQAVIYQINSSNGAFIAEIAASNPQTFGAQAVAERYWFFNVGSWPTLQAGTRYFIGLRRTNGTTTSNAGLRFHSAANSFVTAPIAISGVYSIAKNTTPNVGDIPGLFSNTTTVWNVGVIHEG